MIRTPFAYRSVPRGACSVSRRRFLRIAAGTLGALGTALLLPRPAWAAGRDPNPIPGGNPNPTGGPFLHFNFPGSVDVTGTAENPVGSPGNPGGEPSTITDFDGIIGVAHVQGTGTGTDTATGNTSPLLFDVDTRFMLGTYKSVDGRFLDARLVFV